MIVITSEKEGTEDYSVQLVQPDLPMIKGKKYRVTFDAYADEERDIMYKKAIEAMRIYQGVGGEDNEENIF